MTTDTRAMPAAARMDAIYRWQVGIYDLTRKYYLLGRDALIDGLKPPAGGSVLEVGCGTGRNLIVAARRYPTTEFFGFDISPVMLAEARRSVARAGLSERIQLAEADAASFDAATMFGRAAFDRVFCSYTLSMIPPWQQALVRAADDLAPGGELHVVDFGGQERLPGPFRSVLRGWLRQFHVEPRDAFATVMGEVAGSRGLSLAIERPYRGYAVHAIARRPGLA